MKLSLMERFEKRFIPEPNSGCWLWLGNASNSFRDRSWRPFMYDGGRLRTAHRISFELFKGPIPDGLFICHRCNNSMCVNPDHIYAGTAKQNAADMMRSGRHLSQRCPKELARIKTLSVDACKRRRAQKFCKRGHPLSGENLSVSKLGYRTCKTCVRMCSRAFYLASKKAEI